MCSSSAFCYFKVDPDVDKEAQTNKKGIVGERLCKVCFSGFCPKNVTDVMPLECFFCKEVTTWYLYGDLNRMRCTNCECHRQINCWAAEECQKCGIYKEKGLFTFNEISWCEECFRL